MFFFWESLLCFSFWHLFVSLRKWRAAMWPCCSTAPLRRPSTGTGGSLFSISLQSWTGLTPWFPSWICCCFSFACLTACSEVWSWTVWIRRGSTMSTSKWWPIWMAPSCEQIQIILTRWFHKFCFSDKQWQVSASKHNGIVDYWKHRWQYSQAYIIYAVQRMANITAVPRSEERSWLKTLLGAFHAQRIL